jgi:predicted CopG family antitoxin
MSDSKYKHIVVHEKVYNDLRELGKTPDSFNSIIKRLIEERKAGGCSGFSHCPNSAPAFASEDGSK